MAMLGEGRLWWKGRRSRVRGLTQAHESAKTHVMNPFPLIPGVSVFLLAAAFVAEGGTVINFDGTSGLGGTTVANQGFGSFNSVGGTNFGGDSGTSDRRGTRLGLATPLLASSAEYTGPSIHGGYESILFDTGSGNIVSSTGLIETSADDVRIRTNFTSTSATPGAAASGFIYFAPSGSGITFDASSKLSVTMGAAQNFTARWVINDGGTFYVSSSTFALASGATTEVTDPNSLTWASYAPTTTLLNFNQSAATFSSRTFTEVLGAGIYYENDLVTTADASPQMEMVKFSMDAVPEPGSLSLLAAAGLILLGRRRK